MHDSRLTHRAEGIMQVDANFHFPEASANELTLPALDAIAKVPEFNVTAV